ncbi:MAG: glucodextranase DOMON-like domain-containing protein [Nannocystaceae bacterium]
MLLCACPSDDSPADPDTSTGTTGGTAETLTITDPTTITNPTDPDTGSDTSGSSGSTTAAVDSSGTDSGSSSSDDGGSSSSGEPVGVWEVDFSSGTLMDPAGDDYGPGTYVYPMGVPMGTADLRSFQLDYTAASETLSFTIGLEAITDNTRISLLLLDDAAWANAGVDTVFTVGGTEVRGPNWNDSGVQMILMDPASPLFDFGAINDIDPFSDNPRPDNAIYLRESSGAPFLGADGMFSTSMMNLERLGVTVDTMVDPNTLSFDIDANLLSPFLDTNGSNLYVAIWTYTLIDLPMDQWFQIEFGAVELTEALGGLPNAAADNWRDVDAYDMMFFDGGPTQEEFLLVPELFMGDPAGTVVTFESLGEGVLEIPTGA